MMSHGTIFGAPIEFILFGITLVGVAVFHRNTMRVALAVEADGLVHVVAGKGDAAAHSIANSRCS